MKIETLGDENLMRLLTTWKIIYKIWVKDGEDSYSIIVNIHSLKYTSLIKNSSGHHFRFFRGKLCLSVALESAFLTHYLLPCESINLKQHSNEWQLISITLFITRSIFPSVFNKSEAKFNKNYIFLLDAHHFINTINNNRKSILCHFIFISFLLNGKIDTSNIIHIEHIMAWSMVNSIIL